MLRRALIIGIDDYPGSPLPGCVADARRMQQVLARHHDGAPNFDCRTLLVERGKGATLSLPKLREALAQHFAEDADLAFLHFSGHGLLTELGGYLVTTDATAYDEGLSMRDLLTMANDAPIPEVVITLDCCHSGSLGRVGSAPRDHAVLREGVALMTASGSGQAAMDAEQGGLFTGLLVAGLEGQAADVFGNVTIAGLYAHIDPYLGAWAQRPRLRANLKRLSALRRLPAPVPLEVLRKIPEYFERPDSLYRLDPSYEPSAQPRDERHEQIFADLQRLGRRFIVEPVGQSHMYHAAMQGGGCQLTPLGRHCWHLVKSARL